MIRLYLQHERSGLRYETSRAPGFLSLAQFFLDNGANPNVICCHNESYWGAKQGTALDLFAGELRKRSGHVDPVDDEIGKSLIEKLTEEGAEFSRPLQTLAKKHPHYFSSSFKAGIEELQQFPEQIEGEKIFTIQSRGFPSQSDRFSVSDYNDLVRVIIQRDEANFQRALANCDSNHQSTATGLSPIHFAVTWPMALTALIQTGVEVNVEDHFHRRPIHLAVALGETEAVNILLEEDCAIWTHDSSLPLIREALQGKSAENRQCIANSVIIAHIDRYTRFFDLALSMLPQSPTLAEIPPETVDERLIPQVQQELQSHHCRIPPALELRTDGSSVYDTADFQALNRLNVQMADTLWNGGFRQIHEYSNRGTTPLLESWYNADFEMIRWLVSKGASPFSRHERTQGSGLHLYAHRLAFPGAYFKHISAVYFDEAIVSQLDSDLDSRRDSCCCLCSVGGCCPVVIYLKNIYHDKEWEYVGSRGSEYDVCLIQLRLFWKKWPPTLGEEQNSMEAVLRFLVFENMNLKHQCCFLGQMAENYRERWPVTEENPPESGCEMEARLREYQDQMQSCECPLLEKPLCVVLRDHCKSH